MCFFGAFRQTPEEQNNFKVLGVDFNPQVSLPGGVSSARLISMPRSGYMRIFRKIVGQTDCPKFLKTF